MVSGQTDADVGMTMQVPVVLLLPNAPLAKQKLLELVHAASPLGLQVGLQACPVAQTPAMLSLPS